MIKTSIIISVYNAQEHLKGCLERLWKQTQTETEIIVIDLGSTDNSLEILKSYQKEHDNIIVICQNNREFGTARNAGIKMANGECIYFLDTENILDNDALDILYQIIVNNKLDFALLFDKDKYIADDDLDYNKIYSGIDFGKLFIEKYPMVIKMCSFYFKRDFLLKCGFIDEDNLLCEDMGVAVKAYMYAKKIMCVPKKLYWKKIEYNSFMESDSKKLCLKEYLINLKCICKYINENFDEPGNKEVFFKYWTVQFYDMLRTCNILEMQNDESLVLLADEMIQELSICAFISQNLDEQFFKSLQLFLSYIPENFGSLDSRWKLCNILGKWQEENSDVCIYGTGKIAERIISMLQAGKLRRKNIIFAVTKKEEEEDNYLSYPLIEIKNLKNYIHVSEIIVASTKFQNEMLEEIEKLFADKYKVTTYKELLKNMERKVSIIVPVYNGEQYLERCVNSLLKQSYECIEILIVNDGSTDNSLAISQRYAQKDKRCIVLNQKNSGVTYARKMGVRNATGEYVAFVDCDDWIEPDMIEKMLTIQGENDFDIVCLGHLREIENSENKKEIGQIAPGVYSERELKLFYKKMFYVDQVSGWGVWPSLWGKLYKKEIIRYAIDQVDTRIIYGEDTAALFTACFYAKRIAVSEQYLYHYNTLNENSVSKTANKYLLDSMYYLYCYMETLFGQQEDRDTLLVQLRLYMGNIMSHAGKILFHTSYRPADFFWNQKESEKWKKKYDNLVWRMKNLLEYHDWIVPYDIIGNAKDIILCGNGEIAESYKRQLNNSNIKISVQIGNIAEIHKIDQYRYDCILIATKDIHEKCIFELELLKLGVRENQIMWKEPLFI